MIPIPALGLPAKLLILIAGLAFAFAAGWRVCDWRNDARLLESERQAAAQYRAGTERLLRLNHSIGQDLAIARTRAADERRTFARRLHDNTQPLAFCMPGIRPAGSPPDPDPVRLSADFGRLWNDALAIGLPADHRPGRDHGPDPWADPAASVTPEDALGNLAENGEQCNDLRERLIQAQRWAVGVSAGRNPHP